MHTNLHILVVNDSPIMRRLIVVLLNELRCLKISEAIDGAMALRAFKSSQALGAAIDFVITDCSMPIMDGLSLIRSIRDNPELSPLPILMITPEANKENILAAAKAGADGYIVRPFNSVALGHKINGILSARGLALLDSP